MNLQKTKVSNEFGEKLDVLIEGNNKADEVIVFVHGYGTDKDEGFASFIDLSNAFKEKFLCIRFDQSGYGKSEGKDSEFQFQKAAGDLKSVLGWVREQYPDKRVNIIAHSLGVFITLLLSPDNVERFLFTSIVNADTKYVADNLRDRIIKGGGEVSEDGITKYKRSRGAVQLIGKDFWRTLININPTKLLSELGKKSKVFVYKPLQDDVLGEKHFSEYKEIKEIKYIELDGDHNFTKLVDRENLITELKTALLS